MNKKLTISFIVISLFGCGKALEIGSEESIAISKTLLVTDTLRINLPDTIPHIKSEPRPFFSTDNESFGYLNGSSDNQMLICRYLFDKNSWELIHLNRQGPNQVYGAGAYSFLDLDSFYFFPVNAPKILRVGSEGTVLNNYEYASDRMVAYNSSVKSPKIYDDGESIYFDIGEYRRLEDESTFEVSNLIGVYNYKTDKFKKIVKYPNEFRNNTWSSNDVERDFVVHNKHIYFNFSKSEDIYVYDLEGKFIKKSKIKVNQIRDSEGLKVDDAFENALAQLNNGYYTNLIYDPWRNVFYRIGIHFDINQDVKTGNELGSAFPKRTMTIVTFDQELTVIAKDEFLSVRLGISEDYFIVREDGFYMYATFPGSTEKEYTFLKMELNDINQH